MLRLEMARRCARFISSTCSQPHRFMHRTFSQRYAFYRFPFDYQYLEIALAFHPCTDGVHPYTNRGHKTGKVKDKHGYHGYVSCDNPKRFRYKSGHKIDRTANWLVDWEFKKIAGEARSKSIIKYKGGVANAANGGLDLYAKDLYMLQMLVRRDPTKFFQDSFFLIALIDISALFAFAIPVEAIADRLSVLLTMLLTAMAFKWMIGDKLPNLPYLTKLDTYVVTTFFSISLQGLYCCFAMNKVVSMAVAYAPTVTPSGNDSVVVDPYVSVAGASMDEDNYFFAHSLTGTPKIAFTLVEANG